VRGSQGRVEVEDFFRVFAGRRSEGVITEKIAARPRPTEGRHLRRLKRGLRRESMNWSGATSHEPLPRITEPLNIEFHDSDPREWSGFPGHPGRWSHDVSGTRSDFLHQHDQRGRRLSATTFESRQKEAPPDPQGTQRQGRGRVAREVTERHILRKPRVDRRGFPRPLKEPSPHAKRGREPSVQRP